jgi:carbonic anhydrase
MSKLKSMLERSKECAARQSAAGTLRPSPPQAQPNARAIIVARADMRVDSAHVLEIKPGEAVGMRNIGRRITPPRRYAPPLHSLFWAHSRAVIVSPADWQEWRFSRPLSLALVESILASK